MIYDYLSYQYYMFENIALQRAKREAEEEKQLLMSKGLLRAVAVRPMGNALYLLVDGVDEPIALSRVKGFQSAPCHIQMTEDGYFEVITDGINPAAQECDV